MAEKNKKYTSLQRWLSEYVLVVSLAFKVAIRSAFNFFAKRENEMESMNPFHERVSVYL